MFNSQQTYERRIAMSSWSYRTCRITSVPICICSMVNQLIGDSLIVTSSARLNKSRRHQGLSNLDIAFPSSKDRYPDLCELRVSLVTEKV